MFLHTKQHNALPVFGACDSNIPIIDLQDICFAYEDRIILRHFDFKMQQGECVLLEGSNGCGKTTLFRILNGLSFPQQGTYRFLGQEINEKSMKKTDMAKAFHQSIGYLFQNVDAQLFCTSVAQEIAFAPRQMQLSEEIVQERTEDLLELLQISDLRNRPPYQLSGGEKKKAALASVLSANPQMLILDEPLAGLDQASQSIVCRLLRDLQDAGKTILLTSHFGREEEEKALYAACSQTIRLNANQPK